MKLKLEPTQQLYFTSDTHYMHQNICRGTTRWSNADGFTRNFDTLDQMNDRIVNGINAAVGQDDILFHLGDWSFGGFESIKEFRDRIVCQNVHLVLGNHDHHIENDRDDVQSLFSSVNNYLDLDVRWWIAGKKKERVRFICMHYPIASWNGMNDGTIHLHGHVHLPKHLRMAAGKAMDVGVDGNDLEPIEMDDILIKMVSRPIAKLTLPKDHHEKRLI